MLKVNNRITRKRREICSKLTIKIPKIKNKNVFIVDFEQVNVSWKVLSDVSYYCDQLFNNQPQVSDIVDKSFGFILGHLGILENSR